MCGAVRCLRCEHLVQLFACWARPGRQYGTRWSLCAIHTHNHDERTSHHNASQRNLPQNIKVSGKMLLVIQSKRTTGNERTQRHTRRQKKNQQQQQQHATACHHFVVLTNSRSHWGCELVALLWLTPSSDYLLVMENSLDANKMLAYVQTGPVATDFILFIYLVSLLLFGSFLSTALVSLPLWFLAPASQLREIRVSVCVCVCVQHRFARHAIHFFSPVHTASVRSQLRVVYRNCNERVFTIHARTEWRMNHKL